MEVKLNDKIITLPDGATLADALEAGSVAPNGIATAVNSKVVPAADRPTTTLSDGDSILIIKAFYGG